MLKDGDDVASGKQFDQKMKPYLVYQYLMKHSDEDNVVPTSELVAYLQEIGISAERRSIYRVSTGFYTDFSNRILYKFNKILCGTNEGKEKHTF